MGDDNGYRKIEQYNNATIDSMAKKYRIILEELGEKPEREGLLKTPERVAKSMAFLTSGYNLDPSEILRSAMFNEK